MKMKIELTVKEMYAILKPIVESKYNLVIENGYFRHNPQDIPNGYMRFEGEPKQTPEAPKSVVDETDRKITPDL